MPAQSALGGSPASLHCSAVHRRQNIALCEIFILGMVCTEEWQSPYALFLKINLFWFVCACAYCFSFLNGTQWCLCLIQMSHQAWQQEAYFSDKRSRINGVLRENSLGFMWEWDKAHCWDSWPTAQVMKAVLFLYHVLDPSSSLLCPLLFSL